MYQTSSEKIKIDFLQDASPFVLETCSEEREMRIYLELEKQTNIHCLAYEVKDDTTSYPLPKYFTEYSNISENTTLFIQKSFDDYLVMMTLSHGKRIVTLNPHDAESFCLKIASPESVTTSLPVLIAIRGECLSDLLRELFRLALQFTGNLGRHLDEKPLLPRWLDFLGFDTCNFDAREITHDKILQTISRIKQVGFTPSYVVIGEGWQDYGKESFDADPEKFPLGLKGIVDALKLLGVDHVGVLHTATRDRSDFGLNLGEAFEFYDAFYRYLKEHGITFVFVSHQSTSSGEIYKNLMQAIQAASSIHLDCPPFITESLRNENLFYWATARLARCADRTDYNNPLGVKRSIRNFLSNSLWLKYLMEPEFDSWNTLDSMNYALAMFHAISGSVNMISDVPSPQSKQLLDRILLPSGEMLKADAPLTLCEDSLFFDPLEEKKIYKCYTRKMNSGVIGAFNLTKGKKNLHGTVSPSDVKGIEGHSFAVYSFTNGYLGIFTRDQHIPFSLKPNGSDIFTIVPIKDEIAVFGCYHYYLTLGPIRDVTIEEDSVHITSAVAAPILLYCPKEVLEIRRDGHVIPWDRDSKMSLLSIDSRSPIEDRTAIYTITFE